MSFLSLFILSLCISFIGSLQLGPVNSEVLRYSIRGKYKAALLVGIGGSIPEFPYAWIATYLAGSIQQYERLRWLFVLIFVLVLLVMAIRLLVKKRAEFPIETYRVRRKAFIAGFLLASANPQLIFFWSGILLWLEIEQFTTLIRFSIALGASAGAFLLQFLVVKIGNWLYLKKKLKDLGMLDRFMGLLLLGLALWFLYSEFF